MGFNSGFKGLNPVVHMVTTGLYFSNLATGPRKEHRCEAPFLAVD